MCGVLVCMYVSGYLLYRSETMTEHLLEKLAKSLMRLSKRSYPKRQSERLLNFFSNQGKAN